MPDDLLPLFPLNVVLLPGAPLPLHVFEERYKLMIGECLDQSREFGVVRARGEDFESIGCTAEILKVIKRYPDDRLDILTVGQRPFEILSVNHELAYLRAACTFLDDEEEVEPDAENANRALILFHQVLELQSSRADDHELRPDTPFLSFQMAAQLPLDDDSKQQLLGLRHESERLRQLTEYLSNLLVLLEKGRKLRRKAGGNGKLR